MKFFRKWILPYVIFVCFVLLGLVTFQPQTPVLTQLCAGVLYVCLYNTIEMFCVIVGLAFKSLLFIFVGILVSAAGALYIVSLLLMELILPDPLWKLILISVAFSVAEVALREMTPKN